MSTNNSRRPNTNTLNESFSASKIDQVWEKGTVVNGYDPAVWRKDRCGAWMNRSEYGNCNSKYGWEIDHMQPVSKGGGDELSNLQPLQWQNNRNKGDDYPTWYCKVSANAA